LAAQGILDETLMIALRAMGDCLALNGGVRPFLDQLDKNKDGGLTPATSALAAFGT
jgi:hypothetical protein